MSDSAQSTRKCLRTASVAHRMPCTGHLVAKASAAAVGARHFVFFAQTSDELRQAFAIGGRKECAILIALPIVLGEVREVLFEEGKKHGSRAWLQKKWIGEDVVGAGFGCGADDGLQIFAESR